MKERRLAGISDMASGNAFLPAFTERYNERFAVPPTRTQSLHRPLRTTTPRLDESFASSGAQHPGRVVRCHVRACETLGCAPDLKVYSASSQMRLVVAQLHQQQIPPCVWSNNAESMEVCYPTTHLTSNNSTRLKPGKRASVGPD